MPRNYRHIKEYEKEILELKKQGLTKREIGNKFGFSKEQIHNFISGYNRNQRKIAAGISLKRQGRPPKDYDDITELIEAYGKMMGTYRELYTYPKLTRSFNNTNFCDITELWIPETFPYVAFNDSSYDFSHVSLYGFYRHIQLLTEYKLTSLVSQALMKSGLCEDILKKVFNIGRGFFYQTKATRDIIR